MLQVTTLGSGGPSPVNTRWANAANAAFQGALVVHVSAGIVNLFHVSTAEFYVIACISFLAAFALIKYKVRAAKNEQKQTERGDTFRAPNLEDAKNTESSYFLRFGRKPTTFLWSSNPHLVQVGSWRESKPPIHLLSRCHTLSVVFAFVGFALSLIGILCFTWGWQPVSVSVFTSACMGISLIACVSLLGTKKQEVDDRMLYTSM